MSMTLRSHLITLVLVAVLPLLLFSAIVVGLAADSERDATERGLRATGRAVSSAVDHTLDNAIGALEVLATSELLDGGDLPGFHKVAARALEDSVAGSAWPSWTGPADRCSTRCGRRARSFRPSRRAHRGRGPRAPPAHRLGSDRQRPAGARPRRGGRAVLRGRALRGRCFTALDAHDLARVLEAQQLPHQWAAAIVDGHGVVVARVPEPQRFVGQPATAAYVALTARGDSGAARMPGLDGVRRHTVFNRLENAGWTVYLAIPTVTMDAGFRRSLVTLIGGGLVFLAAGIALAVVVGRRLTAPIVALSTAAVRSEPASCRTRRRAAGSRRSPPSAARSRTPRAAGVRSRANAKELLARAEASRERAALLAEASRLLASSLDYEATLERLARLLVPALADLSVVDVVGDDGEIRRVAAVHADPAKDEAARELARRFRPTAAATIRSRARCAAAARS